jgi:hypothetical protein
LHPNERRSPDLAIARVLDVFLGLFVMCVTNSFCLRNYD